MRMSTFPKTDMTTDQIGKSSQITIRHPYYIYAPPYNSASAGIRALYILADALNRAGAACYIAQSVFEGEASSTPANLIAPRLTLEESKRHRAAGLWPITVYPEVVDGNPLRSHASVRYVLNLPGLLGGPKSYSSTEFLYGYGKRLAREIGHPDRSLFIPTIDLESWTDQPSVERTEVCFYASKYRNVHGAEVFGIPDGAIEITRNLANSPTPEALKDLLRRSKRLYIFENTALAIEAPLCGCPVIMMPNPYLAYPIGSEDHGMDGIAWGDDEDEIRRATLTVSGMRVGYQKAIDQFPIELINFISATQKYRDSRPGYLTDCSILTNATYEAGAAEHTLKIFSNSRSLPDLANTIGLAMQKFFSVAKTRGIKSTLQISAKILLRMLGKSQ